MTYRERVPVRKHINELISAGKVRCTNVGKSRLFVATQWRPDDAYLLALFALDIQREGVHLLWQGGWRKNLKAAITVDGTSYDVRRTIYRIRTGVVLSPSQSIRSRCIHENCMAIGCLKVLDKSESIGAQKHSMATRAKMAEMKRRKSKYTPELIQHLRFSELSYNQLSSETGVPFSTIQAIKSGRIWRDFSNPFASLMGGSQ